MKRISKIIFAVIMVGLIFSSNLLTVSAVTVPNSAVVNHYEQGSGNNPLNVARGFAIKKSADGTLMYCLDYHLYAPSNTTYVNKGVTSDNGVAYIMKYAAKDKSYQTYFIGQTALWIYLLDTNQMKDSKNGVVAAYKTAVYSSSNNNNAVATKIRELVAGAKTAGKETAPYLSVDKSATFTLVNKTTYKSSVIKVKNNVSDYNITLSGAPSGTTTEKVAEGFVVMVPASSVGTNNVSFTATVTASKSVVSTYVYYPSAGAYQPVAVPYSETVNLSDKLSLSFTPEQPAKPTVEKQTKVIVDNPKKSCVVSVIKRAKGTNEILEGATFELRDSKGNIVSTWTSGTEAKVFNNLKENTKYTLIETKAPAGYELSGEKVIINTEDCTNTKEVSSYTDNKTEVVEKETTEVVKPVNEVVVENPKTPETVINVPVESTGMSTGVVGGVIGFGAIASGITLIYRKTRKNNL